jgi:hypothetical protein
VSEHYPQCSPDDRNEIIDARFGSPACQLLGVCAAYGVCLRLADPSLAAIIQGSQGLAHTIGLRSAANLADEARRGGYQEGLIAGAEIMGDEAMLKDYEQAMGCTEKPPASPEVPTVIFSDVEGVKLEIFGGDMTFDITGTEIGRAES